MEDAHKYYLRDSLRAGPGKANYTWSPGSTGGRHWHAEQIPDAVCRFLPAFAVPSAAPVHVPEK